MHTNKYFVFIFVLFVLYSCKDKKSKVLSEKAESNTVLEQQRNAILGRSISSIGTILGDSIDAENKVILIYDGYDCETCIDVGYEMSKRIDELANKQKAYVITTSTNIGRDQAKNAYTNYVYYDEHDIIRKELKYIFTPVLLKLDSVAEVEEIFFPSYQRILENETRFVNQSVSK